MHKCQLLHGNQKDMFRLKSVTFLILDSKVWMNVNFFLEIRNNHCLVQIRHFLKSKLQGMDGCQLFIEIRNNYFLVQIRLFLKSNLQIMHKCQLLHGNQE